MNSIYRSDLTALKITKTDINSWNNVNPCHHLIKNIGVATTPTGKKWRVLKRSTGRVLRTNSENSPRWFVNSNKKPK